MCSKQCCRRWSAPACTKFVIITTQCACCTALWTSAVARQARFLETKLKLQRGEDDSDGGSQDDDDHDDAEAAAVRGGLQDKLWGRSKGAYYQSGEKEVCACQHCLLAQQQW